MRKPRKKSETGIYHVMLRGVNRQLIFEDEEDCAKFCELLNFYWDICGYDIYAYCLMSNHVHLLIKEAGPSTDDFIRPVLAHHRMRPKHSQYT